ncbi:MAG: hypothetical protein Q9191_007074 [Dirinaria sp. TL-2023a]
MSMPGWLNDANPLPNGDNGAFNQSADPMSFMQPNSNSFDYTRLQQQDLPQHLQNGSVRNGSPAFQNPQYQTQPLVPSKRPRPREENVAASPRQAPGAISGPRSQTPQQGSYAGLQGAANGAQFPGMTSYQQYPNANSTANQSPVMQNQIFDQQMATQRMQNMSPAAFSPPPQGFPQQASPVSSEHGSRNNTPHNGGQNYGPGMQYGVNPSQPFTPPTGANQMAPPGQFNQGPSNVQQQQQQQQRMSQLRHQQLMRQLHQNNPLQNRQQGSQPNPSMANPGQMVDYQMASRAQHVQAQQAQQAMMMRPGNNLEQLVRNIAQFMQQRGQPFNPHPTVAGRPINLLQLFTIVVRMGGSKKVAATQQWPMVAQHLGIPNQQYMSASQELQYFWQHNLALYEVYYSQQQRQRHMDQQVRAAAQGGDPATTQGPWSPLQQAMSQSPDPQTQRSMQAQAPAQIDRPPRHVPGQNHDPGQGHQNGFPPPQQGGRNRAPSVYSYPQVGSALPPQSAALQGQRRAQSQQSGVSNVKDERPLTPQNLTIKPKGNEPDAPRQDLEKIKDPFSPRIDRYMVGSESETHGGLQVNWWKPERKAGQPEMGDKALEDLIMARPWAPKVSELGLIDIRTLILSLRCGLHAEVRLALDTLATISISRETMALSLDKCEDLVEALIECAEEQLDVLAEHATEVSDEMLINSYEETVRGCETENLSLQDVPDFETEEYELGRSVDRLICVTTILRNFSDIPETQKRLANPALVRFLTTVIRYLGTRNMLLRSHRNTLDFSKDAVIILSNLSQELDLPGKEEALSILHFLLSFAPAPAPTNAEGRDLVFPSYEPLSNRYYPCAVESLAKLLARDDPNRTFYRSIFVLDSTSSPPYDILTRTFGLAIAGLPKNNDPRFRSLSVSAVRVPIMALGLLAAEIIAGLIPNSEHRLARVWLTSQDGFAASLVDLCFIYSTLRTQQAQQHPRTPHDQDTHGHGLITQHGMATLLKLAEKAKDPETSIAWLPSAILPKKDRLLAALSNPLTDGTLLRQMCVYAGTEI